MTIGASGEAVSRDTSNGGRREPYRTREQDEFGDREGRVHPDMGPGLRSPSGDCLPRWASELDLGPCGILPPRHKRLSIATR